MKLSAIQIGIIQFFVTCIFFYIEALMHYNMGRHGKISCTVPPLRENFKMFGIIAVFAALSSGATYLLEKFLTESI